MDPNLFDGISRLFAERKLTRRTALAASGAGIAALAAGAATAQDATPDAVPAEDYTGEKTAYLFVQSFQGGAITPRDGEEGRYMVTLEQGLGQTIYFGDRPSRDVGATATVAFLEGLGFTDDNPPNAALVLETAPGESEIAVVELFNPTYDPTNRGVTYDVAVLENWQESDAFGLREEPADLATLAPAFGTAHLLIDDCPTDLTVTCHPGGNRINQPVGSFTGVDSCWNYAVCLPCEPYGHVQPDRCSTQDYWTDKCNERFEHCIEYDGCVSSFNWFMADC
jgi:hypothetical protein